MKVISLFFMMMFVALSDSLVTKVRVIESSPVYKTISEQTPYQECGEHDVRVRVDCGYGHRSHYRDQRIGVDTLIGATIGVIAGNQIGGGNGRDAAKILGGIGGAIIANKMRHGHGDRSCYENRSEQRCETRYRTSTQERVVGYNNCGFINGQKICKRSQRELRHFKVTVSTY
jgi:uncharacterized protein YcfJ